MTRFIYINKRLNIINEEGTMNFNDNKEKNV